METLFDPPLPTLAATTTGKDFPVRRIFCIGRNYAEHAREMGSDPDRDPPFFFSKWAETVIPSGSTLAYPPATNSFHYEAELVVAIGKAGRAIKADDAHAHIWGYAAGLDMTRRDLQSEAKEKGRPWDAAKNFEQSSPLGLIRPAAELGQNLTGSIQLTVNGDVKQKGNLGELIWPVPEIIAYISGFYRLEAGDLIYTGTPAGVGPVRPGDRMIVSITGLDDCEILIGQPSQD
jgi:fumarylpyruvate hydrolase